MNGLRELLERWAPRTRTRYSVVYVLSDDAPAALSGEGTERVQLDVRRLVASRDASVERDAEMFGYREL